MNGAARPGYLSLGRVFDGTYYLTASGTAERPIVIKGQGHVVAHNYLAHWHDAIDVATYGNPDGAPNVIEDRLPVSIDISGRRTTTRLQMSRCRTNPIRSVYTNLTVSTSG